MRRSISICVLLLVIHSYAGAQDANEKLLVLDLNDSALIEINENHQDSVTIVSSRIAYRTQIQDVQIARSRPETRTRTVHVNGKPKEQTYTVQVPFIEIVKEALMIGVPGDPRFNTIPIADLSAWDADGNALENAELQTRLSKPAAVILLKSKWPDGATIDPTQLAVLRDDIFFVYAAELNHGIPGQQFRRANFLRQKTDEPRDAPESSN